MQKSKNLHISCIVKSYTIIIASCRIQCFFPTEFCCLSTDMVTDCKGCNVLHIFLFYFMILNVILKQFYEWISRIWIINLKLKLTKLKKKRRSKPFNPEKWSYKCNSLLLEGNIVEFNYPLQKRSPWIAQYDSLISTKFLACQHIVWNEKNIQLILFW